MLNNIAFLLEMYLGDHIINNVLNAMIVFVLAGGISKYIQLLSMSGSKSES